MEDAGEGVLHGSDFLLRIQRGIIGNLYLECAVAVPTDGYGQFVKRFLLCLYESEVPLSQCLVDALRNGIVLEGHRRLEESLSQVCLCLYPCERAEIPCSALCCLSLQILECLYDSFVFLCPDTHRHGVDKQAYDVVRPHVRAASAGNDLRENGVIGPAAGM